MTLLVFWQAGHHDFINLDDPQYVTANRHVLDGLTWGGLRWAATTSHAGNWHPLTWLSHMVDVDLSGTDPGGHHKTSVVLHVLNSLLLFGVLHRMTRAPMRSGVVAALFAVHPLHVESVAWVAERKDVLSGSFWMLTMWAYVWYAERSTPVRYATVVFCFAAGLSTKPMLVTLPFVLLLLDVWPLARLPPLSERSGGPTHWTSPRARTTLRRLVWEKLPLFGLAAAASVVTFWAQRSGGAVRGLDELPIGDRLANALVAYVAYIGKMLWPVNLAALYPLTPVNIWHAAGAASLLGLITFLALRSARRHPYLAVGWFWYLGTLVPVIGFIQVGSQRMADRYTYIPLIGLFIAIAWSVPAVLRHSRRAHAALAAATAIVLGASAAVAREQVDVWSDSLRLWRHAVSSTSNNHLAHHYLAHALASAGRYDDAIAHYEWALEISPDYPDAHNGLGVALAATGRHSEAVAHYRHALRVSPQYASALTNLGASLMAQGSVEEAVLHLREAVRLDPQFVEAHTNLGGALARTGKPDEAILSLETALRLAPGSADAHRRLAATLAMLGKTAEAIDHYSAALRIRADDPLAQNGLGAALAAAGRLNEALERYAEAVRLNPDFSEAQANLGNTLARIGRMEEGIEHLLIALRLDPADADARYDVAVLLWRRGQPAEALRHLELLLKQQPSHAAARKMFEDLTGRRTTPGRSPGAVR